MKNRNVLNSPRLQELKKHRQKVFLTKLFIAGLIGIAILVGFMYLFRIPRLNIKEIKVIGNKVIDTEVIKQVVENKISGKYIWLLPKTNIFFYPKSTIKQSLSSEFKRLKDISISIKESNTLEVSVIEREPKYLWCGEKLDLEAKCSFIDDVGFIFDEAPYFSGEVYFKFYGQLPTDFVGFVLFKQMLETMGLKPVAFLKETGNDVRIFLSSATGQIGPEIIFKADADLENIAENLQAGLSTEPLKSGMKNKYSSLLYIDLRYGNKVYFKFQ